LGPLESQTLPNTQDASANICMTDTIILNDVRCFGRDGIIVEWELRFLQNFHLPLPYHHRQGGVLLTRNLDILDPYSSQSSITFILFHALSELTNCSPPSGSHHAAVKINRNFLVAPSRGIAWRAGKVRTELKTEANIGTCCARWAGYLLAICLSGGR
jgi:hypothetical protein